MTNFFANPLRNDCRAARLGVARAPAGREMCPDEHHRSFIGEGFHWGHIWCRICGRMHAIQSWLDQQTKLGVYELQGDEVISGSRTAAG